VLLLTLSHISAYVTTFLLYKLKSRHAVYGGYFIWTPKPAWPLYRLPSYVYIGGILVFSATNPRGLPCDPLVTRGPYLSALEIRSLYIKSYINSPSLLFTLLYFTVSFYCSFQSERKILCAVSVLTKCPSF